MIDNYFGDFRGIDTKEEREERLLTAMGRYPIDFVKKEECRNIFSGIKLYPPLGFDPWPDEERIHLEKVKRLYNRYTDVSCNIGNDHYYRKLGRLLRHPGNADLNRRIFFGSDFMIHLLWYDSYNEFLEYFKETRHLTAAQKIAMDHENPEGFLFG